MAIGNAARCSDSSMIKQLIFAARIPGHVQPVGRPCGIWTYCARKDVKDAGHGTANG